LKIFFFFLGFYVLHLVGVLWGAENIKIPNLLGITGLPPFPLFFLKISILYQSFFIGPFLVILILGASLILFIGIISISCNYYVGKSALYDL